MYSEHVKSTRGKIDVKTRFILEVGIPSFSIVALLAVTAWITIDAIDVLRNPGGDSVNVYFLFGFAAGNFLVDVLCAVLFYIRKDDILKQRRYSLSEALNKSPVSGGGESQHGMNLNMASALTHISGDTLRTAAVFIAAVVSSTTSVSSAVCDAWAAIVVTVTIIFLIVPLSSEIYGIAKVHPYLRDSPDSSASEQTNYDPEVVDSLAREISTSTKSQA